MSTILPLSAPLGPHSPSAAVVLLWAAALALMLGAAYRLSIRRHPYRPCRKCGESGKPGAGASARRSRARPANPIPASQRSFPACPIP